MLPVPFYSPAKHSPADSPAKPGRNPETGRGIFGKGIGSGIPIHLPVAAAPRCGLSRLNYGDAQYHTLSAIASGHSLTRPRGKPPFRSEFRIYAARVGESAEPPEGGTPNGGLKLHPSRPTP